MDEAGLVTPLTGDALAFIREDAHREETRTVDLHALLDSVAADLTELGQDIAVADSGRIPVACRAPARTERDGEEIRVVIEDEGPGIPEAELERVFARFVRLEASRSRDTGGSGLGLAIARGILRGHGGDIRLENRADGGLRVTATLPGTEKP